MPSQTLGDTDGPDIIVVDANSYLYGAGRTTETDDYKFALYKPATPGDYKVIVYSHGNNGGSEAAEAFAQEWTAKGYMVVAPIHADSSESLVTLPATWDPIDRWQFRVDDCKIALDIAIANQTSSGDGAIPEGYTFDVSAPVIAGHSFGANMAALIAGALPYWPISTGSHAWSDDRFVAAMAISGSGGEAADPVPFEADCFDSIDIPFLRLSGAYDFSGDTVDPGDRLDGVFRNLSDPDVHGVWIDHASHRSLTRPSDNPYGLDSDPQASFDASVNATNLFLDAYVGGDSQALADLNALDIGSGQIGTNSGQSLSLGIGADVYFARGGDDSVSGGWGADQIFGMSGADTLAGGLGNDVLNGGEDNDVMQGGVGDDFYVVDTSGDVVVEGLDQGVDQVFANLSYTLPDNVENLVLSSAGDFDGVGNGLDNVLQGSSSNNMLSGLGGDDTLDGRNGADTIQGGLGADTLRGDNAEVLGDDARDVFVYDDTAESQLVNAAPQDKIYNFEFSGWSQDEDNRTADVIDVSGIDADVTVAGDQAFTFIATPYDPEVGGPLFSGPGEIRWMLGDTGAGGTFHGVLAFNTDADQDIDMAIGVYSQAPSTVAFTADYFVL
jgi:Ca2+-binding RTX toxin-like protein